jgi:hypothetical protein
VDRRRGDRYNSAQMVDCFQVNVLDYPPEIVVILPGTNNVSPDWTLCEDDGDTPRPSRQ